MRVHGIINILNFPILLDFKKWLTQTKSLLLCECVLEKYFGPNRSRHRKQEEKRKFTLTLRGRRREGKRKLQEKRRRNGDRRREEKMEEEDCGWGGMGRRLETETERFSHVQTKGFEALDPDPQTQVHLTKQVWLVFQAVSLPRVRAPRGPNSLLPSPHNDIRTRENNCIRADYL